MRHFIPACAACAIWPECRCRFLEVANNASLLPLNLPPGPSHRLTGAGQITPLVQSAKSTYGGGGCARPHQQAHTGSFISPRAHDWRGAEPLPCSGCEEALTGAPSIKPMYSGLPGTISGLSPEPAAGAGAGAELPSCIGLRGVPIGGASWVSPPDSQALRGLTLLEPSQPQPITLPSAKALPPRRRPPGGPAGAQALTLPG